MTPTGKCPFCGSDKLVSGRGEHSGGRGPDCFTVDDASRWTFTLRLNFGFDVGPAATFCADCCMVWSQADRKDAYKFIKDFGNAALKARVFGPQSPRRLDDSFASIPLAFVTQFVAAAPEF
jgi:hypothetical protein